MGSFFYSLMDSDDDNEKGSTRAAPHVQNSELLRYVDDWEGDTCKMEDEHVLPAVVEGTNIRYLLICLASLTIKQKH